MPKEAEQGSKSISPTEAELRNAFAQKCPHCALTAFANLWQDLHSADSSDILEGLLELLSDVIVTIPEKSFQNQVICAATLRLTNDFTAIINGEYKSDQLASLQAKTDGRLQ